MEYSEFFDYCFKTLLGLGVVVFTSYLKSSKDSLKEMEKSIVTLNGNISTLIANDKNKSEELERQRMDIRDIKADVIELKMRVASGDRT